MSRAWETGVWRQVSGGRCLEAAVRQLSGGGPPAVGLRRRVFGGGCLEVGVWRATLREQRSEANGKDCNVWESVQMTVGRNWCSLGYFPWTLRGRRFLKEVLRGRK